MIEEGHNDVAAQPHDYDRDLRSTRGPPANISLFSNSVTYERDTDVDEMTIQFSVIGTSTSATPRSRLGRSRMDWSHDDNSFQYTFETISKENVPTSSLHPVPNPQVNVGHTNNMLPPTAHPPNVNPATAANLGSGVAPPRPSASLAAQVAAAALHRGVVRPRTNDRASDSRSSKRIRTGGDAAVTAGIVAAQNAGNDENNNDNVIIEDDANGNNSDHDDN